MNKYRLVCGDKYVISNAAAVVVSIAAEHEKVGIPWELSRATEGTEDWTVLPHEGVLDCYMIARKAAAAEVQQASNN